MIRDTSSLVKSGRSILSARAKNSDWLARVKSADIAGVTLGPDGADPTFLLETHNKKTSFSNLQQACSTLSNSKLILIRAQALICQLYDMQKLVNCYT